MRSTLFLLILTLSLFLLTAACGNGDQSDDEDDDSHPPADDDQADDDGTPADDDSTPVDDDATPPDDDTIADDDVTPDDDTTLDDDVDYTREPLAVLVCDTICAAVDESVSFSGVGSTDPNGSPLSYEFEFGDGASASGSTAQHAFNQGGAYRVTLTVTNEENYSDSTSCIVAVGDFPTEVGDLDAIDFRKSHYNPVITEPIAEPKHGGMIYGFFISPSNAVPDTILINGLIYVPGASNLDWCEVVPAELTAGNPGILRCHSFSATYDPGEAIELEVRQGETVLWHKTGLLPEPSLSPSYITAGVNEAELLVHVRNDSAVTMTVTGLSINGLNVSDYAVVENPVLAPGQLAIIRVPQCDGINYFYWTVFTVHGFDGRAETAVSRELRLYKPFFAISNWNEADVFHDEAALQNQMNAGINMFIWYPSDADPAETVLPLAEENDFYLFIHRGTFTDPVPDEYFINFVETFGDNPRILANAVKGEGDDEPAYLPLKTLQEHRALWGPTKPLWIYNNCSYFFSNWGSMADIGGEDHYCYWYPKCNSNFPWFYWDQVIFAGWYAEEIKRAAEPHPTWIWTQSLSNDYGLNGFQFQCTSAEEIRSQWYQVLGHGSKTILWFLFREDWDEMCPEEPEQEMARDKAELEPIERIILEGDFTVEGFNWVTSEYTDVDISTTVSPTGMAIILTNLDYDLNLLRPWQWHEKTDLLFELTPPAGFEPQQFLLLDGEDQIELNWQKVAASTWRFQVPSLYVASAILVVPEP